MKYMELVSKRLEAKIAKALPSKFALMFDDWSEVGSHYVATFAMCPANNNSGYELYLLSFPTIKDEIIRTAKSHYNSLEYIISLFGKTFGNLVSIIADNCATSRRLSHLADTHFIGCASHRYILEVNNVFSSYGTRFENVRTIITSLRHSLRRAKLREFTS